MYSDEYYSLAYRGEGGGSISSLALTDGRSFCRLQLRRAKGLGLRIMSGVEEEEAGAAALPIRARNTLCTAAFKFLQEAERFALPLISDTDHN